MSYLWVTMFLLPCLGTDRFTRLGLLAVFKET